jgi:hypothetical protein
MLVEPLRDAWTTFDPMLMHVIQFFQCRLYTRIPIYLVKLLKIWLDLIHVRVHVKHGIVPLLVPDKMCIRSFNTFTLPSKNRHLTQRIFFYYKVSCQMSIHIVVV